MELDYHLTKAQERILDAMPRSDSISWALRRYQGSGLKFWRITINDGHEWEGAHEWNVDGRTLQETVELAVRSIQQQTRP